jgi:hypothetical protein
MFVFRHQNEGKNLNESFENVAKYKCLGAVVRDKNYSDIEMKNRLSSESVYYHYFVFPSIFQKN